jgi:hypothetical protein
MKLTVDSIRNELIAIKVSTIKSPTDMTSIKETSETKDTKGAIILNVMASTPKVTE